MNICRSKDGFIKLHYKIQNSDLWYDSTALLVFLRMISFAHYEDDFTSIRFRSKQRHLKRGEFSATTSELSEKLSLPTGTLRKVLKRLENADRISFETDNRQTIFRICNYDKYQGNEDKQPGKQEGKQKDKRNRGLKEVKEVKDISTNVDMSTGVDAKELFYQLVKNLGFTDSVRFTEERKRKLKLRLKTFTAVDLLRASTIVGNDPFLQGENDAGKRYGDIDYLLRSNENIDKKLNSDSSQVTYRADW